MKYLGDSPRETLKEAGYEHVKYLGDKCHLLKDIETGKFEIFFSNKNKHGWALIWKNTHLEYARFID